MRFICHIHLISVYLRFLLNLSELWVSAQELESS